MSSARLYDQASNAEFIVFFFFGKMRQAAVAVNGPLFTIGAVRWNSLSFRGLLRLDDTLRSWSSSASLFVAILA